jgi:outer membrane protein OmpA-like peptidoglycan-associated protein
VIQSIAKGLETNPNLRLLIEGHTDSVGNAAANMDLSRRRARPSSPSWSLSSRSTPSA